MNYNESLPVHEAYHFEETKRHSFYETRRYYSAFEPETSESVNNYLKTIAEIDAEFMSANVDAGKLRPAYHEPDTHNDARVNGYNDITVSPSTLYHGFMEENY